MLTLYSGMTLSLVFAWATCPAFSGQHAPSEGGLTFYFYFVTKLRSILKYFNAD